MRRFLPGGLGLAVLLLFVGSVSAAYPQGQAVTYTDFSSIHQVAGTSERIFFATTGGITRYNQLEKRWEDPLTGAPGISQSGVERIWVDQFGHDLYAQVFDGLFVYDEALDTWFPTMEVPEGNPFTKHVPPPPIMHAPPGFNYLGSGELIDQYGRYWKISDILDDGSGGWWMGTWGYGAIQARSTNLIMDLLPFGLLQRRVNALCMDSGYLWMGGAVVDPGRTGITGFDPDSNSFHYVESGVRPDFPAIDINCIEVDDEYFYVGTPMGLYVINREREMVERTISRRDGLQDENVLSVAVNGDSIFIGTAEGLSMVEGAITDSIAHVYPMTLAGERIWDIEVVDDRVWVGAGNGAYRLTPGPASLQRFTDDDNVLFSDVYDVERWEDKLWFVSDAGLVELDLKTAETESYHDIAQKITPRALAVNDSIAAVASDKGLTIFFRNDKKPFKREFTTQDGLASNQVYALIMDGDFLWIGTDRGLTRFLWNNPDRVD